MPFEESIPDLRDGIKEIFSNGDGVWAYEFIWVKANGERIVLSQRDPEVQMIPASTNKLFVGFFAYATCPQSKGLLSKMLHYSMNARANSVLKSCGGSETMKSFLSERGLPIADALAVFDGSGKDTRNRSTPRLQVALLENILHTKDYPKFKVLLAQPKSGGTLHARLTDLIGSLYAKTGTLPRDGSTALAGYLEATNGFVLFSIIGNKLPYESRTRARDAVDSMVRLHDRYVGRFGPAPRRAPVAATLPSLSELKSLGEPGAVRAFD